MVPWHGYPRLKAQQDTRRCTKDYNKELDLFRILLFVKQKEGASIFLYLKLNTFGLSKLAPQALMLISSQI